MKEGSGEPATGSVFHLGPEARSLRDNDIHERQRQRTVYRIERAQRRRESCKGYPEGKSVDWLWWWYRSDDSQDDLTRLLRYGFNFKGKFAFSMPIPHHPNPCLHIDGIGIVGLPLSARDAHLIAAAGPSTGEGMMQDTILMNHPEVSFKNPQWDSYVDEVVRDHVWEELGCAPYDTAPRCQFRRLLLQKPGTW